MFNKLIFFLILLSFFYIDLYSQCFSSSGNPIGGTANMGTVNKKTIRISSFYKHACADKYFSGDERTDYNLKKARYNYIGTLLGYGLSDKITIEAELGYFVNKIQEYPMFSIDPDTGRGLSNAVISGKFNLYSNKEKRFEITAGIGGRIPLQSFAIQQNNNDLSIDVQPTMGSYGIVAQLFLIKENSFKGLRYFLINRFEYNFKNKEDYFMNNVQYKFGSVYYTSFFVSKHLWLPWTTGDGIWTVIFQLRNEIKAKRIQNNEIVPASGACLFYVAPQLNVTIHKKWNVSFMFDYPIYQYYNETQLGINYSFLINLTRDISFTKEKEEEKEANM